jgi:kanamycin nucleotidyltransferase
MDVALRKDLSGGHSHQHRLAIARQLAGRIVARHGEVVVAIVVFGSTAIGADGPYSDLDVTVVTRVDLGDQSKCYPCEGLQINLDYQTVEESFDEAREPHGGGCWLTCISLYDPTALTRELASAYRAIGREAHQDAFLRVVRDDLSTSVGKARNAALAGDRSSFIAALCAFSQAACRGLCMLNANRPVMGNASLIAEARSLPIRPPRFSDLIDIISGAVPSCDQTMYDSVEELWAGLLGVVKELGLRWQETDLLV